METYVTAKKRQALSKAVQAVREIIERDPTGAGLDGRVGAGKHPRAARAHDAPPGQVSVNNTVDSDEEGAASDSDADVVAAPEPPNGFRHSDRSAVGLELVRSRIQYCFGEPDGWLSGTVEDFEGGRAFTCDFNDDDAPRVEGLNLHPNEHGTMKRRVRVVCISCWFVFWCGAV